MKHIRSVQSLRRAASTMALHALMENIPMPTRCAWNYTYCIRLFQVEAAYFMIQSRVWAFGRMESDALPGGPRENPRREGAGRWTVSHGPFSPGVRPCGRP